MGTLASRITIVAISLAIIAGGGATPAGASDLACDSDNGCILSLQVNGYLDDIVAHYLTESISEVNEIDGYKAIVLIVNSPGSTIADDELNDLVELMVASDPLVSAWVGPTNSEALGGAAEMVLAVNGPNGDRSTMTPATSIGDIGQQRLRTSQFGDLLAGNASVLRDDKISAGQAEEDGIIARISPIVGDHAINVPGIESDVVEDDEGRPKRQLEASIITRTVPLSWQLFHTAASPAVAYLFLALGIGLLLFEFFTAGVGVAGVVGAGCALMASYGLGVLPTNTWALALCLLSGVAFGIDIQTAIPRFWTYAGMFMWTLGSLFLFDGFRVPIISLFVGIAGMATTMFSGMPSMVRSRFATPTIGRDWLIGQTGTVDQDVSPVGTIRVDGGLWRAITNRATPIVAQDEARVIGIDGMVLEVEPLEGGAQDYREMRNTSGSKSGETSGDTSDK